MVGAWSGEAKRLHTSPLLTTQVHLATARRQRGTTAAAAPHLHPRLPAVERAWDDKWRVLCIENIRTRLVVEAPFLIWGVGRHLRLPFHLSARNNLDFTTRNNAGISLTHLGGPRRHHNTLQTKAKWWSRQPTDTNPLFIHHQAFPPARVPTCDRRARVQRKDLVGSRSGATTRIARLPSPA